jgi:hypothetical protein
VTHDHAGAVVLSDFDRCSHPTRFCSGCRNACR